MFEGLADALCACASAHDLELGQVVTLLDFGELAFALLPMFKVYDWIK